MYTIKVLFVQQEILNFINKLNYIDLCFHYIREKRNKTMNVKYVLTEFQLADVFTKAFSFCDKLKIMHNPTKHTDRESVVVS